MNLKQQLAMRKAKPFNVTLEIEGVGPVEFEVGSITLGQLLNHTKSYPSLNSLINGVNLDDVDDGEKVERTLQFLEAFNVIVALAVRIKDGEEWLSFDLEPGAEDALIPSEVLPQAVLIELGKSVVKNFRTV